MAFSNDPFTGAEQPTPNVSTGYYPTAYARQIGGGYMPLNSTQERNDLPVISGYLAEDGETSGRRRRWMLVYVGGEVRKSYRLVISDATWNAYSTVLAKTNALADNNNWVEESTVASSANVEPYNPSKTYLAYSNYVSYNIDGIVRFFQALQNVPINTDPTGEITDEYWQEVSPEAARQELHVEMDRITLLRCLDYQTWEGEYFMRAGVKYYIPDALPGVNGSVLIEATGLYSADLRTALQNPHGTPPGQRGWYNPTEDINDSTFTPDVTAAPQWVPGRQIEGALVYDQGVVYRVKANLTNALVNPGTAPTYYLALGQGTSTPTITTWLEPVKAQQSAPPSTLGLATGSRYLIGVSPTGAWAGKAQQIAQWNGASWTYYVAVAGNGVVISTTGILLGFNGGFWVVSSSHTQNTDLGTINDSFTIQYLSQNQEMGVCRTILGFGTAQGGAVAAFAYKWRAADNSLVSVWEICTNWTNSIVDVWTPFVTGSAWGSITGLLADQGDLQDALDDKVALAGDTLTGLLLSNLAAQSASSAPERFATLYDLNLLSSLSTAWKSQNARATTTGPLPANTANNATKTLTANANGAWSSADSDAVALAAAESLLVKNEVAAANNGIYVLTDAGSVSTPWVLTRRSDANTITLLRNATLNVEEGATLADKMYTCTVNSGGTLGTTALPWLDRSATSTAADNTTLQSVSGILSIKNSGVTTTQLGGDITTAGKALLTGADAAAQRTTLGVAGIAVAATISGVWTLATTPVFTFATAPGTGLYRGLVLNASRQVVDIPTVYSEILISETAIRGRFTTTGNWDAGGFWIGASESAADIGRWCILTISSVEYYIIIDASGTPQRIKIARI